MTRRTKLDSMEDAARQIEVEYPTVSATVKQVRFGRRPAEWALVIEGPTRHESTSYMTFTMRQFSVLGVDRVLEDASRIA